MAQLSGLSMLVRATAIVIGATAVAAADVDGSPDTLAKRYYGPFGSGSYPSSSGGDSSGNGDSDSFFGSSNGFPGISGSTLEKAIHYRTVHGILASLAIVVLMPVGAILMRIIPGRFAIWIHAIAQVLAYLLFVAGAALGLYLVNTVRFPFSGGSLLSLSSTNAHPIMGIVTLVLLFFQPILGFVHHARFKKLGRRTVWSYLHLWNGRIGISLGIVTGGLGLRLAHASRSAKTAYIIVAAIVWFFWFVVAVLSEFRRGRRSRRGGPTAGVTVSPRPSSRRRDRRVSRDGYYGHSSDGSPVMSAVEPSHSSRIHRHHSPKASESRSRGSSARRYV
ncbi:integral membrane protein [Grosmannia clavigera kw1407]|uniref:Integral membrane protein n=1 Tax=Grosmannia clavigera (strain kw1407 / UAMH 11150) TaxID=655863 RepID=F0XNN9_GROCL|nr:uncharacterized protein CMQ_7541 [Grosmannia clavigera kw1407]EFX00539.1 integral membrane protein [Grosmannia clavigera kw1407]